MTSGWSIDAKSMESVKKQTDKIKATGLTFKQVFATIGHRLEPEIRRELRDNIKLKESDTLVTDLVSVSVKPTGHARFRVEIKGKNKKGEFLLSGRRKTSGLILPKRKKAMKVRESSHPLSGKTIRQARKVRVPGRVDELRDVAVAVVKSQTAAQISKRTGLGVRGGGMVTRGALK